MIIIFREVVKGDEFLYLSYEKVIQLISSDDLAVPFEEKVSKLKCLIIVRLKTNLFKYKDLYFLI